MLAGVTKTLPKGEKRGGRLHSSPGKSLAGRGGGGVSFKGGFGVLDQRRKEQNPSSQELRGSQSNGGKGEA